MSRGVGLQLKPFMIEQSAKWLTTVQNYCHITCSCSSRRVSPSQAGVDFLQDLTTEILCPSGAQHVSIKPSLNLIWALYCLWTDWYILQTRGLHICVCCAFTFSSIATYHMAEAGEYVALTGCTCGSTVEMSSLTPFKIQTGRRCQ